MTYEVTLANETTERIDDADAYQLEGPLTTFFRTTPGRAVVVLTRVGDDPWAYVCDPG